MAHNLIDARPEDFRWQESSLSLDRLLFFHTEIARLMCQWLEEILRITEGFLKVGAVLICPDKNTLYNNFHETWCNETLVAKLFMPHLKVSLTDCTFWLQFPWKWPYNSSETEHGGLCSLYFAQDLISTSWYSFMCDTPCKDQTNQTYWWIGLIGMGHANLSLWMWVTSRRLSVCRNIYNILTCLYDIKNKHQSLAWRSHVYTLLYGDNTSKTWIFKVKSASTMCADIMLWKGMISEFHFLLPLFLCCGVCISMRSMLSDHDHDHGRTWGRCTGILHASQVLMHQVLYAHGRHEHNFLHESNVEGAAWLLNTFIWPCKRVARWTRNWSTTVTWFTSRSCKKDVSLATAWLLVAL